MTRDKAPSTLVKPRAGAAPAIPVEGTPGRHRSTRLLALAAVVLSVLVVSTVWALTRSVTAPEDAVSLQPAQAQESAHDSGIARSVREREQELRAQHDSGIARSLAEREQALRAQQDSGIARLVREREQELRAQHDSGIARLLRERASSGTPGTAP